ncbi:MAG: anhydro-N-acetylmuramic acid kinase, partial [Limnobacter sp.]|nr:anhydro-N-acetylmuramic acid kinase [Limnobacter sp.]
MMFRFGHATHPNWREALELVLVQLEGQLQLEQFASDQTRSQRMGLIYVTDAFDLHLDTIIESLRLRTGFQSWFGGVAPGVCSTGVEYFNLHWLEAKAEVEAFKPADIQATLAELTTQSIATALPADGCEVLVCGG